MNQNERKAARARLLWIGAIFVLLAGCPSAGAGSDDPSDPKTVVYAAGSYNDGGNDLPCYWRDGTRVSLPYGDNGGGRATAIAAIDGKVYTAGSTGYHDYYSCYWTGTTRTDLEGWGAEGIDVAGGTVYTLVGGDWSSGGIIAIGGAYYADSALNHLSGIANADPQRPVWDTTGTDISVEGGIVYTAGYASDGSTSNACYWTGPDTMTILDASAEAKAFCMSGGTVYAAGRYYGGGTAVPSYWIGTTRTDLPIPAEAEEGEATGIAFADGAVYTAGYHGYFDAPSSSYAYTACYWVDDDRYDLPGEGTNSAQAYAIRVFEGSIYVSGCYSDGTKDIPCYWEDGVRVALPGGTSDGYANDIVIVKE